MKRALATAGLLLGALLCIVPANAQTTGVVRGKVVDAEGKPLADVPVVIEFQGGMTRKFESKTNKKGEFMQVGLNPGTYRFSIAQKGFAPFTFDARVSIGLPMDLPPFKLQPGAPGMSADSLQKEFKAAVDLTNAGKLDEAAAAYKTILEKTPDVPEVHQNLGYIYAQKKDYPAAEAAYLKAIELRPEATDVAVALGNLYLEMNQPEKARAMMDKAAASNPADAGAQFRRGVFLLNANQNEEAAKSFEAAIAADPNMAEAYFRLGTLLVGQGKIPEAIQNLEKYLSLNPTEPGNVATAQGLIKALKK